MSSRKREKRCSDLLFRRASSRVLNSRVTCGQALSLTETVCIPHNSYPPQPINMVELKTQRYSFIRTVPITLSVSPAMLSIPGSMHLESQNFKARKVLSSHSEISLICEGNEETGEAKWLVQVW